MQTRAGRRSTAAARRCSRSASARRRPRRSARPRARSARASTRRSRDYKKGWKQYDDVAEQAARREAARPQRARQRSSSRTTYYLSANVLKASEDKTFPGAIVASLASPWGQAVSAGDPANTYFGSYREVFARDLYEAWTGLLADGDLATARDATLFLFERQQLPDGSMPRNSLVNGKTAPDSFGTQLDEVRLPDPDGRPARADRRVALREPHQAGRELPRRARPGVRLERWEEQSGYSPSTIAAEIAGLVAAADLARANGDPASAARLARRRRRLAALDQGLDGDDERPARRPPVLHPALEDRRPERGDHVQRRQRRPDARPARGHRRRLPRARPARRAAGERPGRRSQSLPVVDATIKSTTPSGPGWHRYNGDGYGDGASDGRPWAPSGQGTGHLWPVLSAERAEQALATGDAAGAASLLLGHARVRLRRRADPEQDWELPDLAAVAVRHRPDDRLDRLHERRAAGSASPLTWSAASFVRLAADLAAGRNVALPAVTHARYVAHTQGTTTLTVTSPADNASVAGSPVTVTGTTAPGNTVYVAATNTDANSATTLASTTAAADGSFSVDVAGHGRHERPQRRRRQPDRRDRARAAHGRLRLRAGHAAPRRDRPERRRQRPGQLRLPDVGRLPRRARSTSRQFQVYDAGTDVIFRRQTRDLSPTFGSPLGAQLVDVYVHDPAPRRPRPRRRSRTRNFPIAPAFAWSRLIQVQGFGQRYVDASRRDARHGRRSAATRSRGSSRSACRRRRSGTPGPGWGFTVVLTGQDGFSRRPGARLPADAADVPVRRLRRRRAPTRTARSTRTRCRRRWT